MIRDVGYVLLFLIVGCASLLGLIGLALSFAPDNGLGIASAIIVPGGTMVLLLYCMSVEIGELFGWVAREPCGRPVEGRVVGLGQHVEFPPHDWRSGTCVLAVSTRIGGGAPRAVPFAIRTADTVFRVCIDPGSVCRLQRRGSVRPSIGMQWLRPRLGLSSTPRHPGDVDGWLCVHEGDMIVLWSGLRLKDDTGAADVTADAGAGWSAYRAAEAAWYEPTEVEALGDGPAHIPVGVGSLRDQLVDSAVRLPATWWLIRWWLALSIVLSAPILFEILRAAWLVSPLLPIAGAVAVATLGGLGVRRVFEELRRRVSQIRADVAEPDIPLESAPTATRDLGSLSRPPRQWSLPESLVRAVFGRRGRRLLARGAALLGFVWLCGWAASAYGFLTLVAVVGGLVVVAFVYLSFAPHPPTAAYEPETTRPAGPSVADLPASTVSGAPARHVDGEEAAAPDPERPSP